MSFNEIANSGTLYGLVAAALILITLLILYYFKVCYKHALECGLTKETLSKVIKSSLGLAVIPSIAVVIGLIALVAVIGLPYAWLRLSVLGSVSYEIMASNMALSAMGLDLANADGAAFGMMMWVMCIGITLPLIINPIMIKPIHLGAMKLAGKDEKWGQLAQTTFMASLLIAMTVPIFGRGIVDMLTFITSGAIAILVVTIAQKTKKAWIGDFVMAFSLIGAMAASVGFDALFN